MLTIGDQTMSVVQWSHQPGAAKYSTILDRLKINWEPERAVFEAVTPGRYFERRKGPRVRRKAKFRGLFPVSLTQWGSVISVNYPVTGHKDLVDRIAS